MNVLVVPTNRAEHLAAFLEAWWPWPWDHVLVVQDGPHADAELPPTLRARAGDRLEIASWEEIDATLPEPWIISRRDSAIRSYGFWRAWRAGADIVFTLDDDCFPIGEPADFVDRHRTNLYATPAWQSSVPGLSVRGMPYRNRGVLADVQVSMGLWRGCPDLDAVTTLAAPGPPASIGEVPPRVMPAAQLFPMSGMNLAFRREAACLMYFPPMGDGQPYRRFDDIWCGLVAQRVCRHLGWSIVVGEPCVDHRRASDPFVNLEKEAPGIVANERVWEVVAGIELSAGDPLGCMREVGAALCAHEDDAHLVAWGRGIGAWCALFTDAGPAPTPGAVGGAVPDAP